MERKQLIVNKIGLDIDYTTDTEPTKQKIHQFKNKIERYLIFFSASGKGLHFEIYLKEPITINESFKLREKLGDDKKRLMFSRADYSRGWDFDILFTYKKIRNEWKKREFKEEVIIV